MKLKILFFSITIMLVSCGKPTSKPNETDITKEINSTVQKTEKEVITTTPVITETDEQKEVIIKKDELTKPSLNTKPTHTPVTVKKTEEIVPKTETITTNKAVINPKPEITPTNKVAPTTPSKTVIKQVKETPTTVTPTAKTEEITDKLETKKTEAKATISHKTWGDLLKKHVDNKGNVAYHKFKKDEPILASYLNFLANNKPTQSDSKNKKLAYYINLYNAATVKLILQNYPTKSIKDISSPWDKKWVKVGNETLSLGYIEHKILRKMNEPRIHFAINCASYSCPQLLNTLFTASNMEQLLEKASKNFINDTSRNQFGEKANLSKIFKWYKNDFTDHGSLLEYIAKYKDINTSSKIVYLDYDWALNEKK